MDTFDRLLQYINSLNIIDTHEHLGFESDRVKDEDVFEEWLEHYFSCDLHSAGLSEKELGFVRDSSKDIHERWKKVEPYWHAAESTGYGRALSIAARDIYGIESINSNTIGELNDRFRDAKEKGGHYDNVLKGKSKIDLSIVDSMPIPYREPPHPFVFTLHTNIFLLTNHINQLRETGAVVDMSVHTLSDWMDVTRKYIEKFINGKSRVVCLKSSIAYERSLRFDKVTYAEAEKAFNELFEDRNLAKYRPTVKLSKVFSDYMMHFICKVADDNRIPFQIHTGIQEGTGNIIYDSNPTLLSNLFLEYQNVKFDIFHMGYPYVMEMGTLAKNFQNVFLDMCWGHIISPEAARRALIEWLDVVPANKIHAFGGDYCFVDGVYGHQYLARRNVAFSLAYKVNDGSISISRAEEIAKWMFRDNPIELFKLERFL